MSWAKAVSCHTTHLLCSSRESSVPLGTMPALIKANSTAPYYKNAPHYYCRLGVNSPWIRHRMDQFYRGNLFDRNTSVSTTKHEQICFFFTKGNTYSPPRHCSILPLNWPVAVTSCHDPACDVRASVIKGYVWISLSRLASDEVPGWQPLTHSWPETDSREKIIVPGAILLENASSGSDVRDVLT